MRRNGNSADPTKLNATATEDPVFIAASEAYSSAQLCCTRWSRDILNRTHVGVKQFASCAIPAQCKNKDVLHTNR